MTDDKKEQIRTLEREKIAIEDQLQFEKNKRTRARLEDDLYEVRHTLDILTNGVWYQDPESHQQMKQKQKVH